MANLLQISSPFGRAMEQVDRRGIVEAVYPVLLEKQRHGMDAEALARVVASSAEGYPFPTNLDVAQPVDGMAPASDADHVRAALEVGLSLEDLRGKW